MAFDWGKNIPPAESFGVNSDESDSLDGLDAEVPPEDKKWLATDPKRLAQLAAQERQAKKAEQPVKEQPVVDDSTLGMLGLNDFPDEDDELTEVEFRLEKAQCYKMLINHQLLSGDSKAAQEVEVEVQDFVRTKLGELMGMAKPSVSPAPAVPSVFSDDEVAALKAVASKVLGKPALVAPAPQVVPQQAPTPAPIKQVAKVTPAPSVNNGTAMKRGRGRPRKYPCPNCGQIACVCNKPSEFVSKVSTTPETIATAQPGPFIETLPDGTRIKHVGNRRYKLVKKAVLYADGTSGEEDLEMDVTPRPKPAGAKPYPTEAQVAAAAQAEADIIVQQKSNLIKAATAVSIAKQIQKGDIDE